MSYHLGRKNSICCDWLGVKHVQTLMEIQYKAAFGCTLVTGGVALQIA